MQLEIDTDINPWISEFDINNDKTYLNRLLSMGYNASNTMRVENNSHDRTKEYVNMQTNDIKGVITSLSNTIENLDKRTMSIYEQHTNESENRTNKMIELTESITGKAKTSSTKGLIAENFLENTISQYFPNDTLNVTSKTAHEADMQLISENYPRILIESKNYSQPVPTKEIGASTTGFP